MRRRSWTLQMEQSLCQLMRTKMGIGCWLEMFLGSKFHFPSRFLWILIYFPFNWVENWSNQALIVLIYDFGRMFVESCKRLRLMKRSEAIGLGIYIKFKLDLKNCLKLLYYLFGVFDFFLSIFMIS